MKNFILFILTFLLIACNKVDISKSTVSQNIKIDPVLIKQKIEKSKNFFYYQNYRCIEKNGKSYCYNEKDGFLIFEQIKNFDKKRLLKEYYYNKNGDLLKYGKSSDYPVGVWFFYTGNPKPTKIDADKEFIFTESRLKNWLTYIGAPAYVIKKDILKNNWIIDFGGVLIYLSGKDGKIKDVQIEKIQSMRSSHIIAEDEACIKDTINQENGYQYMLKKCGKPPSIVF